MSKLFEATQVNGLKFENRFVRSATWVAMATDRGAVTPELCNLLAELADGQLGLIIAGHAYVTLEGRAGVRQLGIYSDELVAGLTEMVASVHNRGGKIMSQLAHAGAFADTKLSGRPAVGPSKIETGPGKFCEELSTAGIAEIVAGFRAAAGRAKQAGFDGIQIHAAHGYLLSQFLSPHYNKRSDEYGGPLENRARIVLEVLKEIRDEVGSQMPIFIKINCQDFLSKGLSLEDSIEFGLLLKHAGIDAIELSGGTRDSGRLVPPRMGIKNKEREAYFKQEAAAFHAKVEVPLILVGGIRSFEIAEQMINEGYADYVSMCRPLIREPHLVKRWAAGDTSKATCLSDNLCYKPAREGKGIYCVVQRIQEEKSSQ
jgi:2,4-dienoyl-CoA reductase-like NADH-dependent reductase (Old Yellow Enzyme family)